MNPKFPAACAMWPVPTITIPDLILKALAPAMPDRVRAGHFGDSMSELPRVERFELHQDTGGPGKLSGGLGVIRDYRIIGHDAGLTVTTDRVKYTPPWGLFGGKDAKPNITVTVRENQECS